MPLWLLFYCLGDRHPLPFEERFVAGTLVLLINSIDLCFGMLVLILGEILKPEVTPEGLWREYFIDGHFLLLPVLGLVVVASDDILDSHLMPPGLHIEQECFTITITPLSNT